MRSLHAATVEQTRALWPAVRASRLFATLDELMAFRTAEPWRVRTTDGGEGVVMRAWRRHLEVIAIRGLWASPARIPALAAECVAVAADHGFKSILSPLLTVDALAPFLECGFRVAEKLVVFQGLVDEVACTGAPSPVFTRTATPADLDALATVDAWCFDTFWRYRRPELVEAFSTEHVTVATDSSGSIVGYASCALHGGSVTVGRLAVHPQSRRGGVGTSLLRSCAHWAAERDAFALSLCTQEHNSASRALYSGVGMYELADRYGLAVRDTGGRSSRSLVGSAARLDRTSG